MDPSTVGRKAPGGDHYMDVRMEVQALVSGMQDGECHLGGPEVLRVTADVEERPTRCVHENAVEGRWVGGCQDAQSRAGRVKTTW